MTLRYWFNLILIVACGYGAFVVLVQDYLPYGKNDWRHYLYVAAPWMLLIGSLASWHRCYVWRRMVQDRQSPPVLSRSKYRNHKSKMRPHILEHSCALLFLLAVAALLKQFSVTHIVWWIGSLLGAWFTLRFVMARTK